MEWPTMDCRRGPSRHAAALSLNGPRPIAPSHGENRGSSPLGSANSFKDLADCDPSASNTCPINVCGQPWTIRFASGPRLEGARLGTNAPIVKDAARFETGTRKCGFHVAQLARVLGKLSDEGFEEAVTEAPFKVIFCHDLSEFET